MLPSHYVPSSLRYEADPSQPGRFRVVAFNGQVLAEGIPTEAAARLFAASPGLAHGYDALQDEAVALFRRVFELETFGPDFEDFLHDENGALEGKYPGATQHALWLQDLRDRLAAIAGPDGMLQIAPLQHPQAELF